ncbi:MAG: adenylate kinase [Firmicutes bacterium]|nr:adenylate kinase [Bacillota bacterium]
MKSIIFIAPPAAGKGTQSKLVEKKYQLSHISTGDLLRTATKGSSPADMKLKSLMEKGSLIPDDIILELLKERLMKADCENGYILDGFPRNVIQAKAYEELLQEMHRDMGVVIFLDVPKELCKKRILGRKSCKDCGAIYNDLIAGMESKVDNKCDKCGGELTRRKDDNEQTFETRYQEYLNNTLPLLDYYKKHGILYHVDSTKDTSLVFEDIVKVLEGEISHD